MPASISCITISSGDSTDSTAPSWFNIVVAMAKTSFIVAALASQAFAFPARIDEAIMARAASNANGAWAEGLRQLSVQDPLGVSQSEGNCGIIPCPAFDEEDAFVDITGEHQYIAPAESDIRGPCPGLNAAANHGYLPRNG